MITDPISDMLTRIKNAYMAGKTEVVLPYSNIKSGIAEILKNSGYLKNVSAVEGGKKELKLELVYKNSEAPLSEIKRISKPGRRIYCSAKDMPSVRGGYGVTVVSTPRGIMTGKEAKRQNVGGEIICEIY